MNIQLDYTSNNIIDNMLTQSDILVTDWHILIPSSSEAFRSSS